MEKAFELLNPVTGIVEGTYHNPQPRGAALKAAGKGVKDIILREKDSGNENRAAKLHRFAGSVKPEKWRLPLPGWKVVSVEKKMGKKIPPELNAKGKEAEFEKAGFAIPLLNKPVVRKVGVFDVPSIKGADIYTEVKEFLKTLTLPKTIA
ncbi:MAG: non-histone chromosomal MC1 family protein [Nitrospirota bacterium]|nr:non-histone chromosomal MC1 family protein [Nitrospirota bacterium]